MVINDHVARRYPMADYSDSDSCTSRFEALRLRLDRALRSARGRISELEDQLGQAEATVCDQNDTIVRREVQIRQLLGLLEDLHRGEVFCRFCGMRPAEHAPSCPYAAVLRDITWPT